MTAKQIAIGCAAGLIVVFAWAASGQAQMEWLKKLKGTTPEQRAHLQDAMMAEKLGLSAEQRPRVAALNLEYATKMQPLIDSDHPLAQLPEMRSLNQEKEAALQKLLTPEQFAKLLAAKAEMRERVERRGGQSEPAEP